MNFIDKRILLFIKFNNYNYNLNSNLCKLSLKKNNFISRGAIIKVDFLLPEFFKLSKLKKSKFKMQITFGELRKVSFVGRCISIYKQFGNINSLQIVRNVLSKIAIELGIYYWNFFLYNLQILVKRRIRKAKLYYLRYKPKKYSIVKIK